MLGEAENVEEALAKIKSFTENVREGKWLGYSGKRISDIVSIGVGGSNLGPQMVTEALKQYSDNSLNVHYKIESCVFEKIVLIVEQTQRQLVEVRQWIMIIHDRS